MLFIIRYKYVKQKLYNMKEKIENRLNELYVEYKHLTNPDIVWIKEKGNALTREERVRKCKFLIEELENLLKS